MPDYNTIVDDAAGYWPLQETSGTTAVDSTGNGNDGTLSGLSFASDSVAGPTSFLPNALHATGTTQKRVTIDDDPTLRGGQDFSLCAWAKRIPDLDGNFYFISKGSVSFRRDYGLSWAHPSNNVTFTTEENNDGIDLSHSYDSNNWSFITSTWNESTRLASLYIDGSLVNSGTSSYGSYSGTNAILLFGVGWNGDNTFGREGSLAGVGMWNGVLTPEEITTLYAGPSTSENFYSEVDGLDLELGKTYS